MAGSVLSCPSISSLGRASSPLTHTILSPHTPLHLHPSPSPPHPFSPPLPMFPRACFSTGSDNESDEEIVGKKSFSAQVFGCLPLPRVGTPEKSQR